MTRQARESEPLTPFYLRHFLFNFSSGIISPYISIYAVQLNASTTEMGWLRSLMNLFGNIPQIPWGILSDKLGRYTPAILMGGILSALLWLPLLLVSTSPQFIVIVTLQAFATSIVTPAWASLVGKIAPKSQRGAVTSYIHIAASLGSTGATLLSGYIMSLRSGDLGNMYLFPIIIASVSGLMASIVIIRVRETKQPVTGTSSIDLKAFRRSTGHFQTLCKVSFIHNFFMSISWPLFAITTVRVVNADMMQIAYITVVSSIVSIIVRRFIGRITDRAGRRFLLILSRAGIFIYPTIYALATSVSHLFLANLIGGIFSAISEIVLFAYQLDITSEDQRGSSIALYNTIIGVATFFGSLLGGYIPTIFTSVGFNELHSLQLTYAISAIGRLGGGLLFAKISEHTIYHSTVKQELTRIVTEDIVKTQGQIRRMEERGETVDDEFQDDFDWIVGLTRRRRSESL